MINIAGDVTKNHQPYIVQHVYGLIMQNVAKIKSTKIPQPIKNAMNAKPFQVQYVNVDPSK